MIRDAPELRPTRLLVVAPFVVVVAIGLLWLSNELITIGPFDRASFGWAVPVPMLLVAPAAAGLVGRRLERTPVMAAIVATAVALGVFVTGFLVAVTDRVGCDPAVDKVAVLGLVAPVGLAAAIGYVAAAGTAFLLRERPIAAVLAAISAAALSWFIALSIFAVTFQAATCRYVGS